MMDTKEIMRILPHRYPFLLVDQVLELRPGKDVIGLKNVSFNEPYFQGHFPGEPVMPGVLQVEALAQLGAICLLTGEPLGIRGRVYLAGFKQARFHSVVRSGDRMIMKCELMTRRGGFCLSKGTIEVHDRVVTEAVMTSWYDAHNTISKREREKRVG